MIKKLLVGAVLALGVVGCAQLQTTVATAQSQKELICTNLYAVGDAIKATPNAVTPAQQEVLDTKIAPMVTKVCSTQIPAKFDLTTLANDGVPLVLKVIEASSLAVDQKTQLTFGINLASAVIKQQIQEEKVEASPAQ